jgi:hypothetical protein
MHENLSGYRALRECLYQCGRLTNDARARLADTIQRAPHDTALTLQLNNALLELIGADQRIYSLIHVVEAKAIEEQRRSDQLTTKLRGGQ